MTSGTKRLPIRELVPKESLIALMRDDVIDDVRDRRQPLAITARHDWDATVWPHPAQGETLAKEFRPTRPAISISPRLPRAPRDVDRSRMGGATTAGDQGATSGFGAIHHGYDRTGQTSEIVIPWIASTSRFRKRYAVVFVGPLFVSSTTTAPVSTST